MLSIREIVYPTSPQQAYELLIQKRSATLIGGGAYLRMSKKTLDPAIDLSALGLNTIEHLGDLYRLGAMTTFGDLTRSAALNRSFHGLLHQSIMNVVGLQFRNTVTLGATVYARYGFSDLLPSLLALDASVHLHKAGTMALERFMSHDRSEKDLLTHISLQDNCQWAGCRALRLTVGDYPVLTMALARCTNTWRLAVGARPGAARLGHQTMTLLNSRSWDDHLLETAATTLTDEMVFGTNTRGSVTYRKQLAAALLKDLMKEAMAHAR